MLLPCCACCRQCGHAIAAELSQRWPHIDWDVGVSHHLSQPHLQELNLQQHVIGQIGA